MVRTKFYTHNLIIKMSNSNWKYFPSFAHKNSGIDINNIIITFSLLSSIGFLDSLAFWTKEQFLIRMGSKLCIEKLGLRGHQASESMLRQLCDDASNTLLIEHNGVTQQWITTPFWRIVLVASSQSYRGVDANCWCKRALGDQLQKVDFYCSNSWP